MARRSVNRVPKKHGKAYTGKGSGFGGLGFRVLGLGILGLGVQGLGKACRSSSFCIAVVGIRVARKRRT